MEMKEEWLMPGAVVPVDAETTAALVAEIKRLIGVVGGMALNLQPAQHERVQPDSECKEDDGCPTEKAVLQRFWRKAQQQEPGRNHWEDGDVFERIAARKKQPAQQQQDYWQEEARRYAQNAEFWRGKYEAAIAQHQEPVAWITKNGKGWLRWHRSEDSDKNQDSIPLYTSPPASKPLTDEQIMEMYNEPRSDAEMIAFARAIEAAHGIKGDA